jgi:peptide/nickel transport system ATP-binding protein
LSLIYISHDIAVIAEMTDNMAVMYAGSIVEKGPTSSIFSNPRHAYTRLLLESTPSVVGEKKKLRALDGEPPSLINGLEGCAFSPRCPDPSEDCSKGNLNMELIEVEDGHWADQCCVNCG